MSLSHAAGLLAKEERGDAAGAEDDLFAGSKAPKGRRLVIVEEEEAPTKKGCC